MNANRTSRCAALVASLSLAVAAAAQASRPAVPPPATADEAVTLSAFAVTETPDRGYIASEAVTGTRVATPIRDLPFMVSVITSEFMMDFDFFDIAKDMAYTASLNSVDTQGNSTLRGYGATFYLRNGFYRLGLIDRVNTDRVEVIKGPNAAIYGSTSPAGLINIVTKKPSFTPSQRVSYTVGNREMNRGEINVTGPLGSLWGIQFAHLFSAEGQNNSTDTTFARNRNRLFAENLLAKFRDGSTLTLEIEWSKRKSVTDTGSMPFEYDSSRRVYSAVIRPDLAHVSQGGPDSVQNRELVSYYLTYDKRFSPSWSTRANAYSYFRHAFNFNNGTSDQFDPRTNRFGRGNVMVDPLNEAGGAGQLDNLFDYALFNGRVKNKTLFTLDYSQNWRYRQQTSPNTRVWTINAINLATPDYSLPPRWAFNIITRRDKVRWDVKGALLRQQSALFDQRLLLFASLRRDAVTYNFNFGNQYNRAGGALSTPGAVSHYTDTAWSPNYGFNYKVRRNVAVYASHSQSFSPNGQVAKLNDPHLDNETSVGWDYGIKASFLDDRLVFTTGGYYIDRYGVKTTQRDPITGLNETVAAGTQLSKGVEFEGSWRVSNDLTVLASYSHVNARIIYNGNATTDVGQPPANLPLDQGSFAVKQNFSRGWFRGLAVNAGLTYSGRAYPNSTATDARRGFVAPGYCLLNGGLAYTWRPAESKTRHTVRLSTKNAFDRVYLDNKGNLGDTRGYYFTYTLNH
jgi:outer membrane receptor protein involved in Fe transport